MKTCNAAFSVWNTSLRRLSMIGKTVLITANSANRNHEEKKYSAFVLFYSGCQKNVPIAGGFFATNAYAAILLFGTYL